MRLDRLFVDANILIYAAILNSPFSVPAQQTLAGLHRRGTELWVSRQVLRETAKALMKNNLLNGLPARTGVGHVLARITSVCRVADETEPVTLALLHLINEPGFTPALVHDANVVASMLVNRISHLLTNDRSDFSSFRSLIEVVQLEEFGI